jgi:ABC-type nitrate/sulfonate/bicarbonate transport system substrate-binding protein
MCKGPEVRITTRWLLIMLMVLLLGCSTTQQNPESIVFMAGYKPQANLPFVGAYVAEENGYFDDENLQVEILHSAGRGEHLQLLVAGSVDITTQDAAVVLKRRAEPGLPLVSIGLIGQRGQQAFIALQESGINALSDWKGQRIGFKGTPPPDLLALLDLAGVNEDDVELINVGFDPRILVEGLVDIYPVYNSNEPFLIRSWGYEVNQWHAGDYGVSTMGLAYVTTPDVIKDKPDALKSFMRAVLKGIHYAEQNPTQAVDIVMKYTGPETNAEHMLFMMETEIEDAYSAVTDAYGLGWQTYEQWYALQDILLHYDALPSPVDVEQVFTNEFIPQD